MGHRYAQRRFAANNQLSFCGTHCYLGGSLHNAAVLNPDGTFRHAMLPQRTMVIRAIFVYQPLSHTRTVSPGIAATAPRVGHSFVRTSGIRHMPEAVVVAAIRGKIRVVAIVDDDPSMLTGVGRLLNAHGFVTEAYASAEAFLGRKTVDEASCLVLDIHLGGMSGIELRRQLAATGSMLPVIFMTAVHSDVVEREAIEAGCVAYLRKPFPSRQLIDAIRKVAG
jgi:CheY-like chemotaxis protein